MDLKNTKAMEHFSTDSKFKDLVLASGIVKASAELKNSLADSIGHRAELRIIELLEKHQWKILFHRLKTNIAEIDLILIKNQKVILVEVKTLKNDWCVFDRLHPMQELKFRANLQLFRRRFPQKEISGYVAWVRPYKPIKFCKLSD